MRNAEARTTYRKNYQAPAYLVEKTDLTFELYEDYAAVSASLRMTRNPDADGGTEDVLLLHGQLLILESLAINGTVLTEDQYQVDDESLCIKNIDILSGTSTKPFTLDCRTRIEPQNNTALEGLYKSRKMFCTQCEAEGFRRITYYLDRPDVMSVFTTSISADKSKYPMLLSNGNLVDSGDDGGGRHWVQWHDPFPKPSYLFALVAGDLAHIDDTFVTASGRDVELKIFVEEKDLNKCDHAMDSLKRAMTWDEEVYGREYDLDIFMIVAVDDFNMGAMENKGLNIFNTSCVLANPKTTTDQSFQRVEAVVAHEYFHNWSGNRVTCRDWFQLSLKEGFTVFRDSEFSADMGSRVVKRIEDVSFLRTAQFAEDAGPMAHSVRPDSYMEISNFYTVTIYEKGAEVVRMIHQLFGAEKFRAGSDLYFERHDGQAVTTEDFVKAMEDASGVDLGLFRNWYEQAGTPELNISTHYDAQSQQYRIDVKQSCPATPGQPSKKPFHIPVKLGLLNGSGKEMPLHLLSSTLKPSSEIVLNITQASEQFVFDKVTEMPVPSLLRSFSAPVRLHYDYTEDELVFLMVHDSDGFTRWNASQMLAMKLINSQLPNSTANSIELPPILLTAYSDVLDTVLANQLVDALDKAMVVQLLSLPAEATLIEQSEVADVTAIHRVRENFCNGIAQALEGKFRQVYDNNRDEGAFQTNADAVAKRALKNLCLSYLMRTESTAALSLCELQFDHASNMTDQLAALRYLANAKFEAAQTAKKRALTRFYEQWQNEALVVDQWFAVQASSSRADTLSVVKSLMQHPAFALTNPNKVRSLISVFCMQNHVSFHQECGDGYAFLADQVITLNTLNPQIAARLLTPLTRWKKFDTPRQAKMKAQLERIESSGDLSKDVYEVVQKSLR